MGTRVKPRGAKRPEAKPTTPPLPELMRRILKTHEPKKKPT